MVQKKTIHTSRVEGVIRSLNCAPTDSWPLWLETVSGSASTVSDGCPMRWSRALTRRNPEGGLRVSRKSSDSGNLRQASGNINSDKVPPITNAARHP
jgi:hypothetical protein